MEPLTSAYMNFYNGRTHEPNNFDENEACLSTNYYERKWNDEECKAAFPYVCEVEEPQLGN